MSYASKVRWTADAESKLTQLKTALAKLGYKPFTEYKVMGCYCGRFRSTDGKFTLEVDLGNYERLNLN